MNDLSALPRGTLAVVPAQAILTEYGKVTVVWWTHKIKGLHRNDFIMAAKTDQIATQFAEQE